MDHKQDLIRYIKDARDHGLSDKEIARNLREVGWPEWIIKKTFRDKAVAGEKEPIISIKDLSRTYDFGGEVVTAALNGVDLDIYHSEFVAITGHSGSGKTTLLNMIGLVDLPTTGNVIVQGQNISELNEKQKVQYHLNKISYVFQFYNLIYNYTARENIMFQLRLQGYSKKESQKKADKVVDFLKLSDRADSYPQNLSGGEQQRVAVGRALAKDSEIILADEPTAHLDTKNGQMIISLLRDVNIEFGKTIILISHEAEYAEQADRVVVLQDGQVKEIKEP
ncbi:MAG: ABC transporter ATP-binding protein [Candidatus Paceibacterota bacterium]